MYKFIIYDTSNFEDFPIGGQLTSVRNFLKYVAEEQKEYINQILLLGITTDINKVGKINKVIINGVNFDFLPVLYRDIQLNSVQKSLRIEFLKSLFKFRKHIKNNKNTIHYIHTPEAFIQIKLCHPFAKTVVFSHGSFFNMVDGFRFFKNNKFVAVVFNQFLIWLIKSANLIFTLDKGSTEQYLKYTKKVVQVNNSIELPKEKINREIYHNPIKLLFVGRLSKVKQIDKIIQAVSITEDVVLTVVGDGEEAEYLKHIFKENNLNDKVVFAGAVNPSNVAKYMETHDILIMNSIFEGKPMTILEAMSYGMPIITTNVGGISEMVEEGKNAQFTDGSKESIADKIEIIKSNYSQYSEKSLELAKQYDYKIVNEMIFKAINGK